jgi:hypothetical protein
MDWRSKYPAVILDADDDRMSTKAGDAALGGRQTLKSALLKSRAVTAPKYIYVLKTDLATVTCDAIVNAANDRLRLGAGVAGAIKSLGKRCLIVLFLFLPRHRIYQLCASYRR